MVAEISRQELQDTLFQMTLHGATKKDIEHTRREFKNQMKDANEQKIDRKISIDEFNLMGLNMGRPNKTRVIR